MLDKLRILMLVKISILFILFWPWIVFGQGVGINIVKKGTACRPYDVWVKNITTTPNVIKFVYTWGDGTSDTYGPENAGDTVHHRYAMNQTGRKTIILTSIAKDGTSTANTSFMIYYEDEARILTNEITCDGTLTFTDNSVLHGSPDSTRIIEWDFGDGTTGGNDSIINHTFPSGDSNYTVTMRVNNGCGWSQAQVNVRVATMPEPVINYTIPPCRGGSTQFSVTNKVPDATYIYEWNFGDGTTHSSQSNPIHPYTNVGAYNVTLLTRILNGDPSCKKTSNTTINVLDAPFAGFISSYIPACDSIQVSFSDTTKGADTYHWEFGNGQTFDLKNPPPITFNSPGDYTINLIATNSSTGCWAKASGNITVASKPIANFKVFNVCLGETNTFSDASTADVTDWKWDFNDGTFSEIKDPEHKFDYASNFIVKLVVSNGICSDSVNNIVTIYPAPDVVLNPDTIHICAEDSIKFSINGPNTDTFEWLFGDGVKSESQNPIHAYKNSQSKDTSFLVIINETTSWGCYNSDTSLVIVHPGVKADFFNDASPYPTCGPDTVNFVSTTIGPSGTNLHWDFGDSTIGNNEIEQHVYYNNGRFFNYYKIKLIATTPFGCSDTSNAKIITLNPKPNASFDVDTLKIYPPARFIFNALPEAAGINTWIINGSSYSTNSNVFPTPDGTFPKPGKYIVQHNIQNQFGCTDSSSTLIVIAEPPIAKVNISINTLKGCSPLLVNFHDNSTGTDTTANRWDFGDGYTSEGTNAQHEFFQEGENKITFKTRKKSNNELVTKDTIVIVYPIPSASFKLAPKNPSVPDEPIYCAPTNPDTSEGAEFYTWYFGDGDTSDLMKPSHKYTREGTYLVTLSVRSNHGCINTEQQTDTVVALAHGQIDSPNAFMPRMNGSAGNTINSDDFNNYIFSPISKGVNEYRLDIYDRWGERLFTSYDRTNGWDGYYMGKLCKQDVYVWKVTGRFVTGKGFSKTGTVTLFHSKK